MAAEPMDFSTRAHLAEWMDEPCTYEAFRDCLRDLAQVNRLTLAYRPTLHFLNQVARTAPQPLRIVDVGCGGGDMLRLIERWASANHIQVRLTGIDLNPYAERAAREMTPPSSAIRWVTGNAFEYQAASEIDIVLSSLFTHHLPDDEVPQFLSWMERYTNVGWFINDLHREALPYYGFALLARVMRWHRFVQHDGPVSIRRAFRHADWEAYLAQANITPGAANIHTFRPARLCVARVK